MWSTLVVNKQQKAEVATTTHTDALRMFFVCVCVLPRNADVDGQEKQGDRRRRRR